MAAQAGKDSLVYFKDNAGSPAYQAVAGIRTRSISINSEFVDITNSDSPSMWREGLSGAGVKSVTIKGAGVFKDAVAEAEVVEAMLAGVHRDVKILIPSFGTFEAPCKVTAAEFNGEYNREVAYDFTFESAGEVVFTAV